jgi:hypothetical protein
LRKKFRSDLGVESEEKAAAGDGGDAEERATVKECSVHGASSESEYRTSSLLGRSEAIVTLNGVL